MEERGLSRATIGRRLSTVAGFYRFAVIDGAIEHSPAEYVRRPKIDTESATLGLDRMELGAFIAQGSTGSVVDQALACPLGLLGLRISEALHIDIEHLGIQRGHPRRGGRRHVAGGRGPWLRWRKGARARMRVGQLCPTRRLTAAE